MEFCTGCRFNCGGYCSIEHNYDELETMSDYCDGYSPLRIRESYDKYGDIRGMSFEELVGREYKRYREV